jgi:hypothetical protein
MPEISVNGATLVYEILGEGPPVVLTPTAWNGMEYMRPVAERSLRHPYRRRSE